jgi:hypothetical protein
MPLEFDFPGHNNVVELTSSLVFPFGSRSKDLFPSCNIDKISDEVPHSSSYKYKKKKKMVVMRPKLLEKYTPNLSNVMVKLMKISQPILKLALCNNNKYSLESKNH